MGEYAVDQMMRDFKRAAGVDADRSDFEDEPRKRRPPPTCPQCKRRFGSATAVKDHVRDKHGISQDLKLLLVDQVTRGTSVSIGGKRIDPSTIYKDTKE